MTDCAARWFVAPAGWTPEHANPFSAEGDYGTGWSCFQVSAADDDVVRNGRRPSGLYVATCGRQTPRLAERLGDFLRYESDQGRKVIVDCLETADAEVFIREALAQTAQTTTIRPDDPRWVVHSTTREAWAAIEECGELRCAALLAAADAMPSVLGELLLGDPPDYAQHVALGTVDAIGPEFVVACRQAGTMLPDPDTEYEPGVRLYFDAHRIIRDGLAVRDGLHTLKVRGRLTLQPYLVAAVAAEDLPPLSTDQRWTTSLFLERANREFHRHV